MFQMSVKLDLMMILIKALTGQSKSKISLMSASREVPTYTNGYNAPLSANKNISDWRNVS